jgi:hypothetical protein
MTLKNGQRCRYPSKHNGLCGLHWHALISNRPKLTRRELILISLSVAGNVAQVIQTGISIHDHQQPKPPVTSIARLHPDLNPLPFRRGRVEEGRLTGASQAADCFPSPLIKLDVSISNIQLSDWFHRSTHASDPHHMVPCDGTEDFSLRNCDTAGSKGHQCYAVL